jgi:hypothetical protein
MMLRKFEWWFKRRGEGILNASSCADRGNAPLSTQNAAERALVLTARATPPIALTAR